MKPKQIDEVRMNYSRTRNRFPLEFHIRGEKIKHRIIFVVQTSTQSNQGFSRTQIPDPKYKTNARKIQKKSENALRIKRGIITI